MNRRPFRPELRALAFLACVAMVMFVAGIVHAAQSQETVSMGRLPTIVVTADVHTAVVLATDAGTNASQRDMVLKWVIDGRDVHVLMRMNMTPSGFYIDLVADNAIGELSTRVTAMALTGQSHPAPARNTIDTATLVAAGGS
jgi:hypothetical protein